MKKITVNHTSININNYELGDCEELEKRLSIWDANRFRMIPSGYFYDAENKQLIIPRGIDINYVERLFDCPADINYDPDPYDKASIKINTLPLDNIQRKSIAFLIGEEDFKYTKKYSQLLLNLPTGKGKTYVTAASLQFFETKAIIITPINKIKKQWHETFITMTNIDECSICDISGSSAIKKLMKTPDLKYKIYLVNHSTINAYAKTYGWNAVHKFFKHIKVGIKIYDEAHLNFENIIRIDSNTNTKRTIYLTATFERSDIKENRLFNICFRNIVRYGYETRKEIRKHIMYVGLMYNSRPSIGQQSYMITNRGFNKLRYAEYQSKSNDFYNSIQYIINYFQKYEGTIMILSTTIEMVESIAEYVRNTFPNLTVGSYHSKMSQEEKDKALDANIISTTPKSAGTGVDIHGLRTVIMCEPYSSLVQADQVSGRLREYSKTDNTFYVELVDKGFRKVFDMYKRRLPVFKKKCKKLLTLEM